MAIRLFRTKPSWSKYTVRNLFSSMFLVAAIICFLSWIALPTLAEEKNSASDGVMPLRLPEQTNPEIRALQERVYLFAQRQSKHLLTLVHPVAGDPEMKIATDQAPGSDWVRRNGCAVQALAFLYRFGPYDEKYMGIGRKELLEKNIVPMMRYLACTHLTAPGPIPADDQWGDSWQSALWTQHLARAAWWSWEGLPEDLRRSVSRVVAHEADFLVNTTPPHRLRENTKAEENAWMSLIFDKAVILLPADPRRPAWEKAFQRWTLSSFLRPADERSEKIIDGRPLSEQFTGANIFDDFTLENHRMIHPDYMGAIIWPMGCELDFSMSGRTPPESIRHNVPGIYENLKWFFLRDGGCLYPNGEDWELFNIADWTDQNIIMAAYSDDPDAWSLVKKCWATTEKMAARSTEGSICIPEEIYYPGCVQGLAEEFARYWLMLQGMKRIVDRPQPLLGIKRLDSGKIILHRTPKAVHSVSWGAVVMAQCVPWRLDRVVSPDKENGVGHIRLVNGKRNLPVNVQSANVVEKADGFVADLVVHHGDAVRAELQFRSNADGSFVVSEKLTALGDIATVEIATGAVGILNNPKWVYETHRRRIRFGDQTTEVHALSGKVVESAGVRRIDVDGGLTIESPLPLSARYQGTKDIDRGRATDKLYLNYLGGQRNWKRGDVVSTYEVVLTPCNGAPEQAMVRTFDNRRAARQLDGDKRR
jgi:hypothetical protein